MNLVDVLAKDVGRVLLVCAGAFAGLAVWFAVM